MAVAHNGTRKASRRDEKQPYHHGDLRAALMVAALALIEEHGVKGFALKDAARMAGVSIAAPYRHFADKDALISAIHAEGFGLFDAALTAAYELEGDAHARILELGVAYVRFALERTAHFRVMFGRMGGEGFKAGAEGAKGFQLLVRAVEGLMPGASEQSEHSRMDTVLACWSLVHGFALLQVDGAFASTVGGLDAEAQLRRTLGVLIAGVNESTSGG